MLIVYFGAFFGVVFAQKKHTFRVGMEFGGGFLEGSLDDRWDIRQDVSPYNYGYNSGDYQSGRSFDGMNFTYVGIKPQVSLMNERINIFSGVRFTMFNGRTDGSYNNRGRYFYLRTPNPDAIEFYRVSSIRERVGYLSVPLEISYRIFRIQRVGFSVKAGTEMGLKMYDKQGVDFESSKMQPYEKEILENAGVKLNSLYATFYGAMGCQYVAKNGIQYNAEFLIPSSILTKNNNSIIDPDIFSGFQLSVQFPTTMVFTTK